MTKALAFAQLVLALVASSLVVYSGTREVVAVYVLMLAAYTIEFCARLKAENEQPRTEIKVVALPDQWPGIDDVHTDLFYDPSAFHGLRDDELPREGLG